MPLAAEAIVQGQDNRVAEPLEDDFVVFWPLGRDRIETNVDSFSDEAWLASISAGVMTVTKMLAGKVISGAKPSANAALAAGTTVGTQISGTPGGLGTYNVSPAQTVAPGTIFQAGGGIYLQPTKFRLQIDVHGPNSADNAQIISTMMRDDYGVMFFNSLPGTGGLVVPLYADDPRQTPFSNDQQQVEDRWTIDAALQVNAAVLLPQQFAGNVAVGLINVDATYPP